MTPEEIERLLNALEQLNETLQSYVATSRADPFRDLKVFVLGLMTALAAGWVSHWLTERRDEGQRRLDEWERLKAWDEDGHKTDLRGTDLTPRWLWLRLHLPRALERRLPLPRHLDLEEVNLGADPLYEASANLVRAKLPLVNLTAANLEQADLRYANLEQATLRYANLREAQLLGTNLKDADLSHAILEEADLADADLQGADLRHADLQGADLRRVNLENANLASARLDRAYLLAVNLQAANLTGANLRVTSLRGSELQRARWDDETVWPEGFIPPPDAIHVAT